MEQFVLSLGYAGLVLASFGAATLLPLGSEAAVLLMLGLDYDPWLVLLVASIGNCAGSLFTYWMGRWGRRVFLVEHLEGRFVTLQHAKDLCQRWGAPVVFFAWVPVIGDVLTVAAGVLHMPIVPFVLWMSAGKVLRYVVLIGGAIALF